MNLVDRLVPMVQVARKVQEVQEVRRFPFDPQPMVQQDLSVRLARLGLCLPDHPLRLHFQTVQKDLVVQEVLNRQLDLLVQLVLWDREVHEDQEILDFLVDQYLQPVQKVLTVQLGH